MRIGLYVTLVTVAIILVYLLLPGGTPANETAAIAVLLVALGGVLGMAALPWQRLFDKGWAIPVFYGWSLADIVLISMLVVFTGGYDSPLFLIYALTTIFFAASYPPRGQAMLLGATAGCYVLALLISDGGFNGTELFLRLGALALIAAITLSIARELISQIVQKDASEHAMRESEERFRLVAGASTDAIWDWDLPTDTVWWSDGFETLFGYSRDEVEPTSESWARLIHPEDRERVVADMHAALDSGRNRWTAEYRFRRKDGSYANVMDRGRVIGESDGTPVRMIGGMTDFTARHNLERQLTHSQKMESIGRLAGGIAHDFNNHLAVILATVDLSKDRLADTDPHAADLEEIRTAAERAAALTRQLLAFSRNQTLYPQQVNLNSAIEEVLNMIRRLIREDIEVRFLPSSDLGDVLVDPSQLEQVLVNLAINARDAMPDGGILTIQTGDVELEEDADDRPEDVAAGQHALLTVSDTGVGMDDATLREIFEPFFTTKGPDYGTGLGLSTVYGIIHQSGGTIRVDSTPGEGSTFMIYLPLVPAEGHVQLPPTKRWDYSGAETVLLVEDEDALRDLTTRVLETSGYTVLAVPSGEDALELIEEYGGVDLLLADIMLPGMSGDELARRIALCQDGTRVLYTSGYGDESIIGCLTTGRPFLAKPFSRDELLGKVREALDMSPAEI